LNANTMTYLPSPRTATLRHNDGKPLRRIVIEYDGRTLTRNTRCPCGSGRKFKACCMDDVLAELKAKGQDRS